MNTPNTPDIRDLRPSERADLDAVRAAEQQAIAAKRLSALRHDFTNTFKTDHGKRVLAWLMERSGFGKVILSADRKTGSVDPMLTTFAAMELNTYTTIRQYIDPTILQEIEYGSIRPSGTITSSPNEPNKRSRRKSSK